MRNTRYFSITLQHCPLKLWTYQSIMDLGSFTLVWFWVFAVLIVPSLMMVSAFSMLNFKYVLVTIMDLKTKSLPAFMGPLARTIKTSITEAYVSTHSLPFCDHLYLRLRDLQCMCSSDLVIFGLINQKWQNCCCSLWSLQCWCYCLLYGHCRNSKIEFLSVLEPEKRNQIEDPRDDLQYPCTDYLIEFPLKGHVIHRLKMKCDWFSF